MPAVGWPCELSIEPWQNLQHRCRLDRRGSLFYDWFISRISSKSLHQTASQCLCPEIFSLISYSKGISSMTVLNFVTPNLSEHSFHLAAFELFGFLKWFLIRQFYCNQWNYTGIDPSVISMNKIQKSPNSDEPVCSWWWWVPFSLEFAVLCIFSLVFLQVQTPVWLKGVDRVDSMTAFAAYVALTAH